MVADQALPVRGVRARAALTGLTPEARRWSETCCTAAAGRGHLSLLQWLRAEGCAWDAQTCSRAAFGGHLEVLIWARQNGCEWTAGTVAKAALGGALECLQVRVLGRVGRAVSARRHVGGNAMSADMSAASSGPRRAELAEPVGVPDASPTASGANPARAAALPLGEAASGPASNRG